VTPETRRSGSRAQLGDTARPSHLADDGASLQRNSLLLLASTMAVGIANYGFSLVLVWILATRSFAVVASVNSLLVIVGTAGSAALPWLVARRVATYPSGSQERREAVAFAFAGSIVLGTVTVAIVVAIASTYAPPGVLLALGVTTIALFLGAPGVGYLQGSGRFGRLALILVVEAVLKVGLGAALAAAGLGPTGAITGAAVGAVVLAAAGLNALRGEMALPRLRVARELWRQVGGVGGIQVAVSVLATLDVVVGSVVDGSSRSFGRYQAMLVFARIPLFISIALSFVAYPRLTAAGIEERNRLIKQMTTLYLVACVITVGAVASMPSRLLGLVLPEAYASSYALLLPLALAGFGAGMVNMVTTFLQAEGVFRSTLRILSGGLILAVIAEWRMASPVAHLAWAAAGTNLAVAAVLVVMAARHFQHARLLRRSTASAVAVAGVGALLLAARPQFGVWLLLVLIFGACVTLASRPLWQFPATSYPASTALVSPPAEFPAVLGSTVLGTRRFSRARSVRSFRRVITWGVDRLRPVASPTVLSGILAARSLMGAGTCRHRAGGQPRSRRRSSSGRREHRLRRHSGEPGR
jgi:O-antigen/teichoic acid export membrane protein